MKKAEFIKLIAEKADITQKDVIAVIDAFEDVLINEIFLKEDSVRLGIGTFLGYTKPAKKERMGRNPVTGESVVISAKEPESGCPKIKFNKNMKNKS